MNDQPIRSTPWWKTIATVTSSILGFFGIIVGLAPLVSDDARQWYKDQWFLGWMAAVAVFLVGSVVFAILRNREVSSVPLTKRDTRLGECKSDVALVDRWIGRFMTRGELRVKLEQMPTEKVFSRQLSNGFHQLEVDLNDGSKEIFDVTLRSALEELEDSFYSYWGTFVDLLDGPGELFGGTWDLTIMTPPGGNWEGQTREKEWDSFYVFVNSLVPLKNTFLAKVDAVEKIANRLRIEADLPSRW